VNLLRQHRAPQQIRLTRTQTHTRTQYYQLVYLVLNLARNFYSQLVPGGWATSALAATNLLQVTWRENVRVASL
jgi:hypothetical protein